MSQHAIAASLATVIDPELGIDIVSLGLVYGILDEDRLLVRMAVTAQDCPMADVLAGAVAAKLRLEAEGRPIEIEIVDEPPWAVDMVDEAGRERLGLPTRH